MTMLPRRLSQLHIRARFLRPLIPRGRIGARSISASTPLFFTGARRIDLSKKPAYAPQSPISSQDELPSTVIKVSPEVEEALFSGRPVVALETTIYTHGFPYPDNVTLALDLEDVVRKNGAVPATIGSAARPAAIS